MKKLIILFYLTFCPLLALVNVCHGRVVGQILTLPKNAAPMDIYSLDIDQDGNDELIVTSLDYMRRDHAMPLVIFKNTGNFHFVDATSTYFNSIPTFFHARHVILIPNFNGSAPAFFVSDHGIDLPPFDGGISRLFVFDVKTRKFSDQSAFFNLDKKKAFTFASTFTHLPKTGELAILKANILTSKSHLEFFVFDKKNQSVDRVADLMNYSSEKCYMNALFADLDRDGEDELVLGGCDVHEAKPIFAENDVILKMQSGKYTKLIDLPQRHSAPFWGVNALYASDLFNSGKPLLIEAIYNNTYSRGGINIFAQQSDSRFKTSFQFTPKLKEYDFFIPWLAFYDVDGDHLVDIVGNYRLMGKPRLKNAKAVDSIFILKNTGSNFVLMNKRLFPSEKNKFYVNAIVINEKKQKNLAFLTTDGKLIFANAPMK